jgi:lipopolysaccharide/colanic/teichoic acid biosynthesis glycosyltransferase
MEMNQSASFRSYCVPRTVDFEFSGFYYIGSSTTHIEKLVQVFKRGYASEGMANVKAELLRSFSQEKGILPEAILCEARFDFSEIRAFSHFLKNHPILRSIPFILDGSGLLESDLQLYRQHTRPDEILFLRNCGDQELRGKIQFLRKIKAANGKRTTPPIEENFQKRYRIGPLTKRVFDILASSLAILLLLPLLLIVALAIKLESRGPILYIAKRAGRGYKIFNFFKFRTMIEDADQKMNELTHLNQYNPESKGPVFFKINNDPRITRIGTFLRNTSLDELPQLFNVFLGDMSLVGNRPLPLYEAATLTTDDYAPRFLAPAGITGLWQIKKRGNRDMSVEERINIDIDYASNCNFATDFWIIASTPSALLQKENV